ncbi:hypothetical protein PAERUG_E15_London_28_01_14_09203 [Pseudomonas aeruginosa]|nr:hypothetical protein PAERUG_E15_London_28_01_14_09203 [Pseudomonas aeruginosa]
MCIRERAAGHVQVDHLAGAAGNGRHREAAGVGEQVEHAAAGGLLLHPAAAQAHVEEQPGVLVAPQVEAEAQSVFHDVPGFQRLARKPFAGAVWAVAVLQDQVPALARSPGRRRGQLPQGPAQGLQFLRLRLLEQSHQQDALQPVRGQLFQVRPAAAATMEQTAGLRRRRGQRGEQVLEEGIEGFAIHGGSALKKGRILPVA